MALVASRGSKKSHRDALVAPLVHLANVNKSSKTGGSLALVAIMALLSWLKSHIVTFEPPLMALVALVALLSWLKPSHCEGFRHAHKKMHFWQQSIFGVL